MALSSRCLTGVLLLVLTGCGVATRLGAPGISVEVRPARDEEKLILAQAIAPLPVALDDAVDDGPTGIPVRDACKIALGIVASRAINAAIGPGGTDPCVHFRLLVTEGALQTLPLGEMMALLAHELAHVYLGHLSPPGEPSSLPPELIVDAPSRAVSFAAFTDVGPIPDGPSRRFSRADESEADHMATRMLSRVGHTARCLDLAELLERLAGRGGIPAPWLSTHPPIVERARHARSLCDRGGGLPRPGGSLRVDATPPLPEARW